MVKNFKDYGIWFNGHHSKEFGLSVGEGKKIGFPAKKKSLVSIPHSNTVYDFSSITGEQVYEEREVVIPFNIYKETMWTKERMYSIWTKVVNWLMNTQNKTVLYDDAMEDYYYLAEVQEEPNFDEMSRYGILTVTFKCYPFRISKIKEGHNLWDNINFELDYLQPVSFEIQGSKEITLYNAGIAVSYPKVTASSPVEILISGVRLNIPAGTSEHTELLLIPGENKLVISGNANVDFLFYKELI